LQDLNYKIAQISTTVKGKLIQNSPNDSIINDVIIDSRKLISTESVLFIALKTKRNDGHRYILELHQKGVRNFMVLQLDEEFKELDANFIIVDDTLKGLQQFSKFHRMQFHFPVIGITGSNGKTIIKEWLYQSMNERYKIVRSPKSYNSQIGVPLSILQITDQHNFGIFEAGISEPEEMQNLEDIIQPNIGVFTNIGHAHDQSFVDERQKINEKLKLFLKSEVLIFCSDYGSITERIYSLEVFRSKKLIDWSTQNKEAKLFISKIDKRQSFTEIIGVYNSKEIKLRIPFVDEASTENALHVATTMLYLDFSKEDISKKLLQLAPVAMRLELKEGVNHCSVINDSYNSDLSSLSIALDFLGQQKQHKKKTLILSDILQSGKDEVDLYEEVSSMLVRKNIDRIIGIGKAISRQRNLFPMEKYFFDNTAEFIAYFPFTKFNHETILLKGARTFEFEKINKVLEQKVHETVMEINLNALLNNFHFFRSLTKPEVKIMVMVKAFSYGSGSFEIANLLQFHNIDYLAVAYADEGIELRKAGISLPIMVMNPEQDAFDLMIYHQLEPEIYSFNILDKLEKAIQQNIIPENKPIGIHLKIDTGMRRLGFEEDDMDALINRLKNNRKIILRSVFSHLAASDEEVHDEFTLQQINTFERCSSKICKAFDYPIIRHILNSAGISRFPEYHYDMVRLGIGIYGVASDKIIQPKLENVSSLKTTISQIKHIKKGESIGYSRSHIAQHDMIIATLPIGYADGLDRRLSNGQGHLKIAGQSAAIVGNICMDMCMIDITNIEAHEGDTVIVFGDENPIAELAKTLDSIPYEVLTSVSRRVKRVYFQE
jgi:alanine racemase